MSERLTRAQLPLLDRLIDDAPGIAREPALSPAEAMGAMRRSVRRDLEALLNARRRWQSWPAGYTELKLSPVGYGVADFGAGAFNAPEQRERLRAAIEDTVRRFEPRFVSVRVSLIDSDDRLDTTVRLRIDALLRADPAPEPVAFDTLVDATTEIMQVREHAGDAFGGSGNV